MGWFAGNHQDWSGEGFNIIKLLYRTEITRYHEGIFSGIIETLLTYLGKTAVEGAQTTLHCCLTDLAFLQPGGFYQDCQLTVTQAGHMARYLSIP